MSGAIVLSVSKAGRVGLLFSLLVVGLCTTVSANGGENALTGYSQIRQRDLVAAQRSLLAPADGVLLGAYVNPDNRWTDDTDAIAKVQAFQTLIGRPLAIDLHYYDWRNIFPTRLEHWDLANGITPLITWYGPRLADITSGASDSLIRERALGVKALAAPVFLRWGWEMNGNWYLHSGAQNAPDGPAKFVEAWRRIHQIFDEVGASNAIFVWSPNFESVPHDPWNNWRNYYPGDQYVDWVGIDAYNWGTTTTWSRWHDLAGLVRPIYDAYAARKPIMLAETASAEAGGDKAQWISQAGSEIERAFPMLKAFIWFNVAKETDWRIESSVTALAAFRKLARSAYFNPIGIVARAKLPS